MSNLYIAALVFVALVSSVEVSSTIVPQRCGELLMNRDFKDGKTSWNGEIAFRGNDGVEYFTEIEQDGIVPADLMEAFKDSRLNVIISLDTVGTEGCEMFVQQEDVSRRQVAVCDGQGVALRAMPSLGLSFNVSTEETSCLIKSVTALACEAPTYDEGCPTPVEVDLLHGHRHEVLVAPAVYPRIEFAIPDDFVQVVDAMEAQLTIVPVKTEGPETEACVFRVDVTTDKTQNYRGSFAIVTDKPVTIPMPLHSGVIYNTSYQASCDFNNVQVWIHPRSGVCGFYGSVQAAEEIAGDEGIVCSKL